MTSIKELFGKPAKGSVKGITQKNNQIKRSIIAFMAVNGECTLADLSKQLHISIPTITKLVGELVLDKVVCDMGKVETAGGRRPNTFGLKNTSIFFVGVEAARDHIRYVITDIKNNSIETKLDSDFILADTPECLDRICEGINNFLSESSIDKSKILGIGVCMPGRVNSKSGQSHHFFAKGDKPLSERIEAKTGIRVMIENDTRARCYAEYFAGNIDNRKCVLYLYLGRGVAVGIVVDGKLYYGKSGFAGEFGHTPFFNNDIICACGKKGCLETEVSGVALENKVVSLIENGANTLLREQYESGRRIHINDIVEAAKNNDELAISLIEDAGEKAGKSIAFLVNIFNPELVVIGGNMARAGDYLMFPLLSSVNKYSMNLIYKDTKFSLSQIGDMSGALGSAMLIRNTIIGV